MGDIQIDITKPEIAISYDNNTTDSRSYFKADRTAAIVVTERNFDPNDVKITLKNTDGVIPKLSGWRESTGTGNRDNTKWTATLLYNADGDYTFDIAYTDMAENACSGANYGNSVQPQAFTIDKTLPVIEVTYDNNDAQNGNYYKDTRKATMVIREHNFSADRVKVTITATDDGNAKQSPKVSEWSTSGDTHAATILYQDDAKYTFDITCTDLAGNEAADYKREEFFIDKTAPSLQITGVKDQSANKGEVIPVITYSDTNLDTDSVIVSLSGANRKDVSIDDIYEEIHNGAKLTIKDFEKVKENDDIYTLTVSLKDLAGNTSEQQIMHSVNRFGSTYALSQETENINGMYIQKPVDVQLAETNANALDNVKITLFKNNETIILAEGVDFDYSIDMEGGDGQWYHYTYTVYAKNFAEDGTYRLLIHSEDEAGNIAENTLDTKNTTIGFGVDSTAPTITVTNLESNTTYAIDNLTVELFIKDNLMLDSLTLYLDDYDKALKTWNAEEIAALVAADKPFAFDVTGESTRSHKVKMVCKDAAGNETVEEIKDFYVTTNLFVRYYTNTPLLVGSIIGVIGIAAVTVFLVLRKRKLTEKAK